uniref:Cell cycle checkpoint protein RAD17 n=1 Tax=Timema douglasi TaxID=61478 RepID=A0A7R8ZAI1_TIMDO|nr:unnamed protein product [Timema douglasi]
MEEPSVRSKRLQRCGSKSMGINLNEFEIFGVSRKETKAIKTRHGESWLDSYAPQHTKDLAVHNKKVDELSAWMSSAVDNHSEFPMVLLITGPAGCGKTITLQVLAKNMDINVREWVNPVTFTLDEGSRSDELDETPSSLSFMSLISLADSQFEIISFNSFSVSIHLLREDAMINTTI